MNDSLNLVYTLDLAIDHDYDFSIIGESAESKRSESLGEVKLREISKDIFEVDGYGWEYEYDENGKYESLGIAIDCSTSFMKDSFRTEYFRSMKIVDIQGEIMVEGRVFDTIHFSNDENWNPTVNMFNIQSGENKDIDLESGLETIFAFDTDRIYYIHVNGTYAFKKPIEPDQKVEIFLLFIDNQGEGYRYPLYDIFQ